MSLSDAWTLWAKGHLTDDMVLWGIKLLWWARIGKFLQCAGGATIVADIIGPERLRVFGSSLHGKFTIATAGKYLREGFLWYAAMFRFGVLTRRGTQAEEEALASTSQYYANTLNAIVALPVIGVIWYLFRNGYVWWLQVAALLIGYCVVLVYVSPIFTVLCIVLCLSLGVLADSLIIEPIAWILERQSLDRWIKLFAFVLLVVGFHFDFLTS